MPSSPDSSSDSSTGSPQHPYEGPNVEAENCLPGVVSIESLGCLAVLLSLIIVCEFMYVFMFGLLNSNATFYYLSLFCILN